MLSRLEGMMSIRERSVGWGQRMGAGIVGGVSVLGILLLATGCRGNQQGAVTVLLEQISREVHSKAERPKPGELAEKGRTAITEECAKQSYTTASKGLIVSETGYREDVFALRDRVSYGEIAYELDEAQRLEALLEAEVKTTTLPAEQKDCIAEFIEHLETLSDPLVEADVRQKELDVSAFSNAAKEAQEQAEKKLHEAEKLSEVGTQPSDSSPRSQP
jgi:exoribonuclease R